MVQRALTFRIWNTVYMCRPGVSLSTACEGSVDTAKERGRGAAAGREEIRADRGRRALALVAEISRDFWKSYSRKD